jgi:hypothetical protein
MSHTQTQENEARERILQTDVELLNAHNVGDDFMSLLAAEHAARVETFCKAIEPTLGRSLLLVTAAALLAAAKQITDATVQQPELINVQG